MRPCRIALDAAGGDHGCAPAVEAAVEMSARCEVILIGPMEEITAAASTKLPDGVSVIEAGRTVQMDDDPIKSTRDNRLSSVMVAARAVAEGMADAMVTPGNTGAAVLATTVHFGRIPGVSHPALAVLLPAPLGGAPTVLVDAGAATKCRAEWLVQFADMGVEYHRARLGTPNPTVALLSNGSEDAKGGPLQAEAHRSLSCRNNYLGQIEGHDLLTTTADVVVTDGFTGNVALKTYEGAARVTARALLEISKKTRGVTDEDRGEWIRWLSEVMYVDGGAILLGLKKLCVIGHGASSAKDLSSAMELAALCWKAGVADAIGGRVAAAGSFESRP